MGRGEAKGGEEIRRSGVQEFRSSRVKELKSSKLRIWSVRRWRLVGQKTGEGKKI